MAAIRDQSDTDNWLSRCSIASLLPRTLGSSSSSHAAMLESEDEDFVGNLLKSTALKDSTQLLEQAKTIMNSNCSSIPDGSFGLKDVLSKRTHEVQVELQGKRNLQRRPGLAGRERAKHAFNFSAKTTTASSQILTSELFKGSSSAEAEAPAAESWPVIDYKCLKNISNPVEYFSTYRMLENAEKEVKRLKGEVSLKPSQPHGKRDRQRRPGLANLEGRKAMFRFPDVASSLKDNSLVENPSLSEHSNITEVAVPSPFKESKIEKKADEFEQLLSACRDVDDDIGIANCVREILQLNPIYMGKIGVPGSPSARENLLQNCQLGQISLGTTRNNINVLPILKRWVSLINSQSDVSLPPNGNVQISGAFRNRDVMENLEGNGTHDQNDDFEKVMSTNIATMTTSSMEGSLNNSLFCPEKRAIEADLLSSLKPMSLINMEARLDEISTLKRRIARTNDIQPVVFAHDSSGDHTLGKSLEPNSLSPIKGIHVDHSMDVETVFTEVMPNGRKLCFEGKVNSPIAGTFVVDRNTSKSMVDDVPKQCPHSLLDNVGGRMDGGLGEKEFVSIVSSAGFEEASQALVSVDHGVSNCLANPSTDKLLQHFGSSGTIADIPVELLHTEAPKDDYLPEQSILMDEHVSTSHNILDTSKENHENVVEFGEPRGRNSKRKAPQRKRNLRESISRRKSLAGSGTVIEHGMRRSTRIKMKPLQYWCGERFLYGRVHDSLATVIGVKMLATPGKDGRSVMKVKSYVSEQYADLVAQAALH
ncbi:hypothetical protein HPP92_017345 [Vanilla planifolia]|uniref:Centromere protein C n=1 Tax=Vanilla planifolia TaxID=51239 RepID=A0A835QF84_VANPL|nr:hypothetical protein HPP92_017345 [Vanilla planifolia]